MKTLEDMNTDDFVTVLELAQDSAVEGNRFLDFGEDLYTVNEVFGAAKRRILAAAHLTAEKPVTEQSKVISSIFQQLHELRCKVDSMTCPSELDRVLWRIEMVANDCDRLWWPNGSIAASLRCILRDAK